MSKGMNSCHSRSAIRTPLAIVVLVAMAACSPKGDALYQRAEQSLDKGDVRAAVIDLKNLVKAEPGNAKARVLLATALVRSGDVDAAAIEIGKAMELGASAESLLVPKCRVMTARMEFDQMLTRCRPDAVPADQKAEMQIAQGRAQLGLGRAAEAKVEFSRALATQPENLDALLGAASSIYALEGLPAAKAFLDGAPTGLQARPAYWMAVGGLSGTGGDLVAAEQAYQKALEAADKAGPGSGGDRLMALGALAETQMRQGKIKEATATAALLEKAAPRNPVVKQLRAQVAAAAGNFDEARTLLEEAVAAMPDNYEARTLLGLVNMQQGNLGQAQMHFQSVVAKQPNNVRVQQLLAETRAQLQTPDQALEGLKPALAAADADPALLAMAGRMSLASGDRDQAMEYFTLATAKSPGQNSAETQFEIANGFLMAGDVDRAIEMLQKMPAGGADDLQRESLLLAALLRKGENDKAVAEARALVERRGTDARARNLAAATFFSVGQKDEARAQLQEALKLKPNDAATYINLARIDLGERKLDDAEKNFKKALDAEPKSGIAGIGLAVVAAARGDRVQAEKWLQKIIADNPGSIEAQLVLAQFYMGTNDFGKAKAVIDQAMTKAPENAALHNVRGLAQLGLQDVPGAVTSLRKATSLAPKAYGYALNLARAQLMGRDVDGALETLNVVLKAEPQHVPALSLAGLAAVQFGQVERAAGYAERLNKAAPNAPVTYQLDAEVAMAQKRYRDAYESFRKANSVGATSQLVVAQFQAASLAGEPKPEAVLEQWVAEHPTDANSVSVLAELRQRAGDRKAAIGLYEKALAGSPDNVVILNNLAVLYDLEGDARAVDIAERAHKGAPNSPAVADTYGWILFKQGKADRAYALLQDAFKGMPDSAEVQYHLAAAMAATGRKGDATVLLRKSLQGKLPDEAQAEARKLLEQLSK